MKKFNKILIANRGEIAVRIIGTARKLGIKTVAVYSELDTDSLHRQLADESYQIGGQELGETYLNIEKIIQVALQSKCQAIHPGYGFLSENPLFVEACDKNNLIFIGPTARAIRLMGNKIEARKLVREIGIPMTEGITGTTKELLNNVPKISFPVLVKAAAGGGGKGMRIVYSADNLQSILETTSREALNYFSDGTIYIEKYIEEPRHIEFQVMGDKFGNLVHLFERECTIQRRYQKIIEESPSPTLTPEIRKKMGEAAVKIAKGIEYSNAGTIEFLVDKDLNFYFLEMNTRIQVEHPVTEMVTGVDMVEEQLWVAAGNKLRLVQENLKQNGHAIECRIYAEDPSNNFMPSPGKMTFYQAPIGDNIRIDSGFNQAVTIQSFYDPMISKLIVWNENRNLAARLALTALRNYTIHGIQTNIEYLIGVIQHQAFIENKLSTKFCDEHTPEILSSIHQSKSFNSSAFIGFALYSLNSNINNGLKNIWQQIGFWRNRMELVIESGELSKVLLFEKKSGNTWSVMMDGQSYLINLLHCGSNKIDFNVNGEKQSAFISFTEKRLAFFSSEGKLFQMKRMDMLDMSEDHVSHNLGDGIGNLFSPMPGKIIKVNVKNGDTVNRGTVMIVVEAMKMENNITAENEATVEQVEVKVGDMVDTDKQLIFLKYKSEN